MSAGSARGAVARIALVLSSLAFLVLVDQALRLSGVNATYRATHPSILSQDDPTVGYRLRPDLRMTATPDAPLRLDGTSPMKPLPPFEVRTNGLGLRHDGEVAGRPPDGTLRILALGDSYTFGYGVDLKDTYPERLGRSLAAVLHRSVVEVVNAGQPGHSSVQGERFYRVVLEGLAADIVMIAYGDNDYGVGIVGYQSAQEKLAAATGATARWRLVLHRSEIYTLLARAVLRAHPPARPDLPTWSKAKGSPGDLERAIAAMIEEARRRGAGQIVVVSEARLPVAQESSFRAAAERAASASRALYADVAANIERALAQAPADSSSNRYFVDATHLSPEGHALAAATILSVLPPSGAE